MAKEKEDALDSSQIYEMGFHILSTIPEEKLQETVSKLEDSITQNGSSIISQEFPKMRALSYDIKKRVETKYLTFNKAYFGWIKFEADLAVADKIKEEVASNGNILRFIIVKTVRENTIYAPRTPMFRKENVREERGEEHAKKTETSEAEIDKSIDELIIN